MENKMSDLKRELGLTEDEDSGLLRLKPLPKEKEIFMPVHNNLKDDIKIIEDNLIMLNKEIEELKKKKTETCNHYYHQIGEMIVKAQVEEMLSKFKKA